MEIVEWLSVLTHHTFAFDLKAKKEKREDKLIWAQRALGKKQI